MTNSTHTDPVPNSMEEAMSNAKNTIQNSLQVLKQTGIQEITWKQWAAIRTTAGMQIDSDTAEVMWVYADTLRYHMGAMGIPRRIFYVRSPESDEWVRFSDLPQAIQDGLMLKHRWIFDRPSELYPLTL
jgi:hypothetical protein